MKRYTVLSGAAMLALSLAGCGAKGGSVWSVLLLIPAILLLLLALLQTKSYFDYCKRQREKGRREPKGMQPITWLLYGLAAVLLILSMVVNQPAKAPEAEALPPETTEQTADTAPTSHAGWLTFSADRELTASQYFVYDPEKGFVNASGETGEKVYPASITKLFTAYVAGQCLRKDMLVTVGDALDMVYPGSSVAELQRGDSLTVSQLIEAMMLPSGNDAAYVLAVEAGRAMGGENLSVADAVNTFVTEMNRQAKALGMLNTHFANPDGIHQADHYSSFDDLALLGALSVQDPVLLEYTGMANDRVNLQSGSVTWKNTNALIDPQSPYYCPHAIGLKTGQTPSAGSCLLSAFTYEGRTLIIGVFGCPEAEDRFADTLQLFNETIGY
ncbi:MAG: D-alanyl-D-alanine carboxypeptidase [Oscillospiraceae bacterium]|nr:D-alanyl-D-alanine carboxypeptidase [Oscillospiraceae bacterium]